MPLNRIKAVLADKGVTAAQLVPYLPDCQSEACMSYITQGRANMTKDDLQAMCEQLRVKPSDVYIMKDLDYSPLVTPRRPKIAQEDNRDRSGRIWMDAGNEEAKERILAQAKRNGYDGWQKMLDLLVTVLNLMDTGLLKLEDGEHDGLQCDTETD